MYAADIYSSCFYTYAFYVNVQTPRTIMYQRPLHYGTGSRSGYSRRNLISYDIEHYV